MPNHFHSIFHIHPIAPNTANPVHYPNGPKPNSIGAILAGFKSTVAQQINQLHKTPGILVGQRNYYEHIIRTEKEYLAIETCVENIPAYWAKDTLSQ
jgi:hypothetical protein